MGSNFAVKLHGLFANSKRYPEIIDGDFRTTEATNYFISFLTDRNFPLVSRWAQTLKKEYGKTFTPIFIVPGPHNQLFTDANFVIINPDLQEVSAQPVVEKILVFDYPEHLNKAFSEGQFSRDLIDLLYEHQGIVPILSFSSLWLELDTKKTFMLGPSPSVTEKFDNKTIHTSIFKELGMQQPNVTVIPNLDTVLSGTREYPFYISASFSSGGAENAVVNSRIELEQYASKIRKLNKDLPFVVADYINNIVASPNTTAIVLNKEQTILMNISDQILRGSSYLGNIYPTSINQVYASRVANMTIAIGNYMSKRGFRGLFGCDFLITRDGICYPTDLNPRRQGGYTPIGLSSAPDITELEFSSFINREPSNVPHYDDFQVEYCWAHTKLTPPEKNMKIIKELENGSPVNPFLKIGSTYAAQFYPKDYTIHHGNPGYYITSGTSYNEVKNRLERTTKQLSEELYEPI